MADQGTEGLLSPFLRSQRIKAARPYIAGRVLDVGCGSGKLASYISADRYVGFDIDELSLSLAQNAHPDHSFHQSMPPETEKFDTIAALAVIEHVPDPYVFMENLIRRLVARPESRIICTTPHPSMEWIHTLGANVGLFSKHGSEEHEELLDQERLQSIAQRKGVKITTYQRFLLGANQLTVFQRLEAEL